MSFEALVCNRLWSVERTVTDGPPQGELLCKPGPEEIRLVDDCLKFCTRSLSCFCLSSSIGYYCIRSYCGWLVLSGPMKSAWALYNQQSRLLCAGSELRQPIRSEYCDTEASWKVLRWAWHLCILELDKHWWEAENSAWQSIWRKSADASIC